MTKFLVIDVERSKDNGKNMYWKNNNHGYTEDMNEARKFIYQEALEIINRPYSNLIMQQIDGGTK